MHRLAAIFIGLAVLATACTGAEFDGPLPDPPVPITYDELVTHVASSGAPTVINVWASWCLPCRSEAALIEAASLLHPGVDFIGLDVKDDPQDAARFIAERLADADMTHYADRSGRIPVDLGGGTGVPITFFYRRGGELAATHLGIIDEPTLARFIDEIDR